MQHHIVLSGHGIFLVPLLPQHAAALFDFVDPQLWAGMAAALPLDSDQLAALFRDRAADPAVLAFAVTDQRTGALLGTTSLCDFVPAQHRVEIGGTFFGRQFWGSHVNTASKNLLLGYAFEVLGVERVAFRCDARNARSAAAIERLGASFEGILRSHRLAPDGGRSDTAVYSLLAGEWPLARAALQRRLAPFAVAAPYRPRTFAAL